jgi:polyphosphate kinase
MTKPGKVKDITNPKYYFNRELSLIEFNKRVLEEAKLTTHPLLERIKFCTIFSSNLDEFFMIRVAGLKSQLAAGINDRLSYDSKTPLEQLKTIRKELLPLYKEQEKLLLKDLLPKLREHNFLLYEIDELTEEDENYIKDYFKEQILPILTPLTIDSSHPFPRLINRTLNIAFVLREKSKTKKDRRLAFLQIPNVLPRFIKLANREGNHFILIENIIIKYASLLFPGMRISTANHFRVTRDADIEIAEDEAEDLLIEIEELVKSRRWGGAAVKLEVSGNMPNYLVEMLRKSLELHKDDVYVLNRPLNLPDFFFLDKLDLHQLKYPSFIGNTPEELQNETSFFDTLKKKDILVHHPFDSFTNTASRFIEEAANDPKVLVIKITLYRTGGDSNIIQSLIKAAENGKEVMAFVELKARFDEENNIIWARELEQAGVHCVYGISGLKTHCKVAMIIRKESHRLKTYFHFSSGNYNQVTAKIYTDVGLFTSKEQYQNDTVNLFNYLTGYSHYNKWESLLIAPTSLEEDLIEKIEREARLSTPSKPGLIFAKMNQLAHRKVIQALYKASQAGVTIKLLVRGVCCLMPGVKGLSENIEVRSIVGRFLEHSRIFYFQNGGNKEYYIGSADWMTRNLNKRVETVVPIYQTDLQEKLQEILDTYWADNKKSWKLLPDGSYQLIKAENGEQPFSAQEYYLSQTGGEKK